MHAYAHLCGAPRCHCTSPSSSLPMPPECGNTHHDTTQATRMWHYTLPHIVLPTLPQCGTHNRPRVATTCCLMRTAMHTKGSPCCTTTRIWHRTSPRMVLQDLVASQCGTRKPHECGLHMPSKCGSLGSPERGPTRTWHTTRWPSDSTSLQAPSVSTPDREATIPPGTTVTTHTPPLSALLIRGMHAGPKPMHSPDSNVCPHPGTLASRRGR